LHLQNYIQAKQISIKRTFKRFWANFWNK